MNISRRVLPLFVVIAAAALADETVSGGTILAAAEITAALKNTTALYDDGAQQFFAADGRTDYQTSDGTPSRGNWWVSSDNKYCSRWNPGGSACYVVTRHDDAQGRFRVRWNEEYPATLHTGNLMTAKE